MGYPTDSIVTMVPEIVLEQEVLENMEVTDPPTSFKLVDLDFEESKYPSSYPSAYPTYEETEMPTVAPSHYPTSHQTEIEDMVEDLFEGLDDDLLLGSIKKHTVEDEIVTLKRAKQQLKPKAM